MVVVACRNIGFAFEFHFIIWRSASNLKAKVLTKDINGGFNGQPCKLPSIRDRGESLPHEDGEHADPDDPAGDPDDHPKVVRLVVHRAHRLLVLLLQVEQHLMVDSKDLPIIN